MRKVSMKFTPTTSETLTKWLKGESDPINKKELAERIGLARQTIHVNIKKMVEGDKKVEDIFTVSEMMKLIDYQNEVADKPKQREIEKQKTIETQLKTINKVRKSQGQEPLSVEEFMKKNFE